MLVRTLVNKVLFVCKRSVGNYFTPYLANKVLFAKVRSSVYKFIRCLAQIYTCCRLSSFGLTKTAKYKLPYILYATCFAESAKRLRHIFRVAPLGRPAPDRPLACGSVSYACAAERFVRIQVFPPGIGAPSSAMVTHNIAKHWPQAKKSAQYIRGRSFSFQAIQILCVLYIEGSYVHYLCVAPGVASSIAQ